jgi:beta-phosphoglucomutase-like phosphatase (HAD superfamily)
MRDRIDHKVASIHDDASADALMVPGARKFLQLLADHHVHLASVSGTEHIHLLRESAALRIDHFLMPASMAATTPVSPKVTPWPHSSIPIILPQDDSFRW